MNKKLKQIEKEIKGNIYYEEYRNTLITIAHAEIGLNWVQTKEAIELVGEKAAKEDMLKYENLLMIKRAELKFLENKINGK